MTKSSATVDGLHPSAKGEIMNKTVTLKHWAYVAMVAAIGIDAAIFGYQIATSAPAKMTSHCIGDYTRVITSDKTDHFSVMWDENCK